MTIIDKTTHKVTKKITSIHPNPIHPNQFTQIHSSKSIHLNPIHLNPKIIFHYKNPDLQFPSAVYKLSSSPSISSIFPCANSQAYSVISWPYYASFPMPYAQFSSLYCHDGYELFRSHHYFNHTFPISH